MALRLEAAGEAAHLLVQPVERRRIFRSAGRPRGVGGLRELIEPCVQLIERLAIAALAFLDPLDEPPEQALNRALVHGAVGGRFAGPVRATGLPSCFRSHPVPHECDAAELFASDRAWDSKARETRDEAVETNRGKAE